MARVFSLALVGLVALALVYVSRFWDWSLWGREGLWGIEALRPQGGLLARWLQGTGLQPFELLVWLVAVFLLLTGLERVLARIARWRGKDG